MVAIDVALHIFVQAPTYCLTDKGNAVTSEHTARYLPGGRGNFNAASVATYCWPPVRTLTWPRTPPVPGGQLAAAACCCSVDVSGGVFPLQSNETWTVRVIGFGLRELVTVQSALLLPCSSST
jgi:hypothetical protein